MLRFGTDGVRGVALTELTTDFVGALGRAVASVVEGSTWLIGRDTRESGPVLRDALAAGLTVHGATVLDCGVLPTPALAHLAAARGVPAAMITASHNPYQDNGVKIFAAGGLKLSDDVERRIESALEAEVLRPPAPAAAGPIGALDGAIDEYVTHIVGLFPAGMLDDEHVVLDCAHGAMSVAAPLALQRLGATVITINAAPDGRNINHECGATNTTALSTVVVEAGADAGLAFDGDGDRVIAVDGEGNVVDGDRLIALGAEQLRAEGALTGDAVVVTVMSNLGFHRAMEQHGIHVVTTAVGDRYVLEALDANDYAIGGEQSGHVIYRHVATTGDGLLAGLKLLQRVGELQRPLADVAGEVMTTFPQVLVNVRVAERHPHVADELADEVSAAERELGGEGRVLLRASGTEPLIRVMVEAATDETARTVADRLAEVVRARFA